MNLTDKLENMVETGFINLEKQAEYIDKDVLFDNLYQAVEIKKQYETYIEALSEYIKENDLSEQEIANIVSDSLKQILYKEASDKSLLTKDVKINKTLDDFF